ncbi:MAG: hypothetical protein Q7R72_01870 [bacterium]|nr:hypothetical protein [bacterium]
MENFNKVGKSRFKNIRPVKDILQENIGFLDILRKINGGIINEGVIAKLPCDRGDLHIDNLKTRNIKQKHGEIPLENLIITATEPTSAVVGIVNKRPYINLIYEDGDTGFLLCAWKFNGHFVVTFFEPGDLKYIKSVKNKGQVLFDKKKTP